MAKFKLGDIIHKIGEKHLRPFKIEGITEDGYYIIEDKGLYLDCSCDDLYELVTDETYRHYTQSCLFYSFLQPPKVKIELDEKEINEMLKPIEIVTGFDNLREYLEQEALKRYFAEDAYNDLKRKAEQL
jgi:hypothetical protein